MCSCLHELFSMVTKYHHKEEGQFASQVEASVPPGADTLCQEAGQVNASTGLCLFPQPVKMTSPRSYEDVTTLKRHSLLR